jgi:hypothetical protein
MFHFNILNKNLLLVFSSETCSLFIKGDKSWQNIWKLRGKIYATGIVSTGNRLKLVLFPSLGIVARCHVCCSKIVHTEYPIKIQHFHMLCTNVLYCLFGNNIIFCRFTLTYSIQRSNRKTPNSTLMKLCILY